MLWRNDSFFLVPLHKVQCDWFAAPPCAQPSWGGGGGGRALSVLSLEPETIMRLSADHASWYTGPTCPRKVATKVPLVPSHSLTDLSNEALATQRPSGENCTCEARAGQGAQSQGLVHVNRSRRLYEQQ